MNYSSGTVNINGGIFNIKSINKRNVGIANDKSGRVIMTRRRDEH